MDSAHPAVAGEQAVWQLAGGGAEEARGVPRVPTQAQAATRRAEGKAGDQLQHSSGTNGHLHLFIFSNGRKHGWIEG